MTHDKAYFIAKFSAIPDDQWRDDGTYGWDTPQKCALGHCGMGDNEASNGRTDEGDALRTLIRGLPTHPFIHLISDGRHPDYQQPTPKARVLAALRDLP